MHQYHYDGENQLDCVDNLDANRNCTVDSVRYAYGPQGRRVGKQQGNTLEEYVYDLAGNVTSVHDGSGSVVRTELYAGSRHVATRSSSGTLSWNHADWLGTERVRTSSTGATSEQCTDTPFGMNVHCTTTDLSPMHFTGKQRDPETTYAASDHLDGLDYFGARFYGGGNRLGRFMTPDPLMNSGRPWNPQTWNRYSYTLNNPVSLIDPRGLWEWGTCSGDADKCAKEKQRFRDSVARAKESLKGLDPKSKEAKALANALKKIGEEGKGDLKVNFGSANGGGVGSAWEHSITIDYDKQDSSLANRNLSQSDIVDLDAGLATHEATHAFGDGLFGFLQAHLSEQKALFTESVTYQGLKFNDPVYYLWNESWLTVDKNYLGTTQQNVDEHRENAIQKEIERQKSEGK